MRIALGQIVVSTAGRDAGKIYLVTGLAAKRVLLADGRERGVTNPKPKNRRHVKVHPCGGAAAPAGPKGWSDLEIRRRIAAVQGTIQADEEGRSHVQTRCN